MSSLYNRWGDGGKWGGGRRWGDQTQGIELSADGSIEASGWSPVQAPETAQEPALFSDGMFSDFIFADFLTPTGSLKLTQPSRPAAEIRFYNRDDVLQGIVSTNAGRSLLGNLRFELLDTGPGMFDFSLAGNPPFEVKHEDRIDIHLWNDPQPYYSGALQSMTWPGATQRTREFSGFGYSEHLNRILLDGTWENKYVWEIVRDLISLQIAPFTRVLYDDSLLERSTAYMVSKFVLQRVSAKDALKQLAALAGGANYGVDEKRRFFWGAQATAVTEHLWYGKHVGGITGDLDAAKLINRQWIKLGSIRTDLSPDDPFLKTNWLKEYIEDPDSINLYGRRDNVFQAPSMLDALDALRAAEVDMTAKATPANPIRLRDVIFAGTKITAQGNLRIVGVGGLELELPKRKATYRATGSRVQLELELGELERSPAVWIAELTSRQAFEDLSRQQAQTQL